ncbi:MAG TPA: acyl-CoA synthetase [Acidimicrobiaceae bacterium]|nr:acyl-CoA synthetase [Acidimicrobiaceae bacterium]
MTEDAEEDLQYPGRWAAEDPDRPAIVMAESGDSMTFGELDAEANRISHLFRGLGIGPGEHVAFCLENRIEFLALAWGAHYAGLYYTAISSRLTADEISYIVQDCGAKVFVTSPFKADEVAEISAATPRVEARFAIGGLVEGYASFEDAVAAQSVEPLEDRTEGQDMLYSSGTTGRPKGVKVPLTGAGLGRASSISLMAEALFGATRGSTYLSPAPLYHAAPLRFCLGAHRIGCTVVVMERFDAEGALLAIERYGVTWSQWVPTMFVRMLKLPDEVRARYDISSLRSAVHAAAPCPVEVKRRMIDWWGPVLHEYYAGTEGNGLTYTNSADWLDHPGTVGKALLGEVLILDDDGEEVQAGEEGTVYFRGNSNFEYHNDPEKTAGAKLRPDTSTLGDVGRLDADGYLYLTDRKAYMIITGGVNVYPQEAENVLTMHPAVHDVAVIGVPNDDFGEEVKAVVQPVDAAVAGPELAAELVAYCQSRLADVKCPRSVDFRSELPRHPTGKLYKRLLKDEYWEGRPGRI